jgi:5-methylcytosine-specific restriction protein A
MTERRRRSDEILLVGYFLARCTDFSDGKKPRPPSALQVDRWGDCYDLFFTRLADGRDSDNFRHTLRNTRDKFDPLFSNGRIGWLDAKRRRHVLSERDVVLHRSWKNRTDQELADHIVETVLGRSRFR